jgi:hypothetical protein
MPSGIETTVPLPSPSNNEVDDTSERGKKKTGAFSGENNKQTAIGLGNLTERTSRLR